MDNCYLKVNTGRLFNWLMGSGLVSRKSSSFMLVMTAGEGQIEKHLVLSLTNRKYAICVIRRPA